MEAGSVPSQINSIDQVLDDFAKGQGHNGQIIASQTQHGDSDDDAEQGRCNGSDEDGDDHSKSRVNGSLHAL